jgi:hypothetical protein
MVPLTEAIRVAVQLPGAWAKMNFKATMPADNTAREIMDSRRLREHPGFADHQLKPVGNHEFTKARVRLNPTGICVVPMCVTSYVFSFHSNFFSTQLNY